MNDKLEEITQAYSGVIGILGSGNMGKQLALLCASRGFPVVIWNHVVRNNFMSEFERLCLIQSKLGFFQKGEIDRIIANISYTDCMENLSRCSLIIEAVKENKNIKMAVFQQLRKFVGNDAIVASNTSTFSTTELAGFFEIPHNFIGIHFFNPPMTLKLVEVIRGELTSEEAVNKSLEFLAVLDKYPVVIPESPGFVVNRVLFPMINEAIFLLSEGIADEKTIDTCMKMGANHPMGPLELADFIGLDVCLSILETLVLETGDAKYRPAHLLKKYVRAGKLGRKSGAGFYSYRKSTGISPKASPGDNPGKLLRTGEASSDPSDEKS